VKKYIPAIYVSTLQYPLLLLKSNIFTYINKYILKLLLCLHKEKKYQNLSLVFLAWKLN